MSTASRLIVVTVPTLTSSAGKLRLFERRRSDAGWSVVGDPFEHLVFRQCAQTRSLAREPIVTELYRHPVEEIGVPKGLSPELTVLSAA